MPQSMILLGMVVALTLMLAGKRKSASAALVFSIALLYSLSIHPVADALLAPIEREHPAFESQRVDLVVVLGGYHASDDSIPTLAQLSSYSLFRLLEGVRIYDANPYSRLVFSGFASADKVPHALVMKQAAISLGVPENDIITESRPRDTDDEARLLRPILEGKRFALVTSASHMTRAVRIFRHYHLSPIPAPTEFLSKPAQPCDWKCALPQTSALQKSERAIYEYLGRAVLILKQALTSD
ncbi:MAG: YdcF family protein [Hahellaceae bacterium]|nr:YdcF family protein [Hahellaceae bacterium]MCP5169245.1 YdcF family protein [Hahellaceae bacterium]